MGLLTGDDRCIELSVLRDGGPGWPGSGASDTWQHPVARTIGRGTCPGACARRCWEVTSNAVPLPFAGADELHSGSFGIWR